MAAAIQTEIARAEAMLRSLAGSSIDTLTVNSLNADDAPFLGQIVSKLSPMIGNLMERRIMIELIEEGAQHGLHWQRQDPDFPDVVLLDQDGDRTGAGYEVKAWYALSTELTGRFRESCNLLAGKNVRVVIIAWVMSHIVYGAPLVIGVLTVDASSVAQKRDQHYHQPPQYLIVEPRDTTARTRNLQQTNVNGYRIQETAPARLKAANELVAGHRGRNAPPHSQEAQALNTELMNSFSYRLDTNFAKVDRIDHPDIESFKSSVLSHVERGRTISEWTKILRALNDSDRPKEQEQAARLIQAVYDRL